MAIDTLEKRYASLTYGHPGRAGTRQPTGTSSAFRRAAALGGYYQASSQPPRVVDGPFTQLRTFSAYVGGRYGDFDKPQSDVPDFMHGSLNLYLSLSGEIYFDHQLRGEIALNP